MMANEYCRGHAGTCRDHRRGRTVLRALMSRWQRGRYRRRKRPACHSRVSPFKKMPLFKDNSGAGGAETVRATRKFIAKTSPGKSVAFQYFRI